MKKMTKKQMYLYGLPGLATLFTFTMFTTYGLYFFTDVVGLSGSFAGFIMTIGTVWDAITDPLVGMISDARDPQKGRRRPFLIAFAIDEAVAFGTLPKNHLGDYLPCRLERFAKSEK